MARPLATCYPVPMHLPWLLRQLRRVLATPATIVTVGCTVLTFTNRKSDSLTMILLLVAVICVIVDVGMLTPLVPQVPFTPSFVPKRLATTAAAAAPLPALAILTSWFLRTLVVSLILASIGTFNLRVCPITGPPQGTFGPPITNEKDLLNNLTGRDLVTIPTLDETNLPVLGPLPNLPVLPIAITVLSLRSSPVVPTLSSVKFSINIPPPLN